jgi:hypothetical protein
MSTITRDIAPTMQMNALQTADQCKWTNQGFATIQYLPYHLTEAKEQ